MASSRYASPDAYKAVGQSTVAANSRYTPKATTILGDRLRTVARYGSPDDYRAALKTARGGSPSIGGRLLGAASWLQAPMRAIVATGEEIGEQVTGKEDQRSWLQNVRDPEYGTGMVLERVMPHGNIWLKRALGLVGDVALDPLTYATFGASPELKALGRSKGLQRLGMDIADYSMELGKFAEAAGATEDAAAALKASSHFDALAEKAAKGGARLSNDELDELARATQFMHQDARYAEKGAGMVRNIEEGSLRYGLGYHIPFAKKFGFEGSGILAGQGPMAAYGRLLENAGSKLATSTRASKLGELIGGQYRDAERVAREGSGAEQRGARRMIDADMQGKGAASKFEKQSGAILDGLEARGRKAGLSGSELREAAQSTEVIDPKTGVAVTPAQEAYLALTPEKRAVVDDYRQFIDALPERTADEARHGNARTVFIHDSRNEGRAYFPGVLSDEFKQVMREKRGRGLKVADRTKVGERAWFEHEALGIGDPIGEGKAAREIARPGDVTDFYPEGAPTREQQIQDAVKETYGDQTVEIFEQDGYKAMRKYQQGLTSQVKNYKVQNYLRDKGISNELMTWMYDDLGKKVNIQTYNGKALKQVEKHNNRVRSLADKLARTHQDIEDAKAAFMDGKVSEADLRDLVNHRETEAAATRAELQDMDSWLAKETERLGGTQAKMAAQETEKEQLAAQIVKQEKQVARAQAKADKFMASMANKPEHWDKLRGLVADIDKAKEQLAKYHTAAPLVADVERRMGNHLEVADYIDKALADGRSIAPDDPHYDFVHDIATRSFGDNLTIPHPETLAEISKMTRAAAEEDAKQLSQYAAEFPAHADPVKWRAESKAAGQRMRYWAGHMDDAILNADDEAFTHAAQQYEQAASAKAFRRDLILRHKNGAPSTLASLPPELGETLHQNMVDAVARATEVQATPHEIQMASLANSREAWLRNLATDPEYLQNPAGHGATWWHGYQGNPVDIKGAFPLEDKLAQNTGAWIDYALAPSLSANYDFSHAWAGHRAGDVQQILLNTTKDRVRVYAPHADNFEDMAALVHEGVPSDLGGHEGTLYDKTLAALHYDNDVSYSLSGQGYDMLVTDLAQRYLDETPGGIHRFIEQAEKVVEEMGAWEGADRWVDRVNTYKLARDIKNFMAANDKPMEWDEALQISGRHYDLLGQRSRSYKKIEHGIEQVKKFRAGELTADEVAGLTENPWMDYSGYEPGGPQFKVNKAKEPTGAIQHPGALDYESGRAGFNLNDLLDPTFPRPEPGQYLPDAAAAGRLLTHQALDTGYRQSVIEAMRESISRDADVVVFFNSEAAGANGEGIIMQALPTNQFTIEPQGGVSALTPPQMIHPDDLEAFTYQAGPLAPRIDQAMQSYTGKMLDPVKMRTLMDSYQDGSEALEAARSQFSMKTWDLKMAQQDVGDAQAQVDWLTARRDPLAAQAKERLDLLTDAQDALAARQLQQTETDAKVAHMHAKAKQMEAALVGSNIRLDQLLKERDRTAEAMTKVLQQGNVPFGFKSQVPSEVADVAASIAKSYDPVEGEGLRSFLSKFDKVNNWMKGWLTASLGFQTRNMFGAMFNNWLAGADITRSTPTWGRIYNMFRPSELAKVGGDVNQIGTPAQRLAFRFNEDLGITGGGLYHSELGKMTGPSPLPTAGIAGGEKSFVLPYYTKKMGEQVVEPIARGSLAYDRLDTAITRGRFKSLGVESWNDVTDQNWEQVLEAAKRSPLSNEVLDDIAKYHFDYDDLSKFERQVMRRVVPFYTWTRKNVPLQVEAMFTQPGKAINRYLSIKRNIELGTDDEDIVPSWFAEQGMIHLPFKFGGSDVYGTMDLPFKDPFKAADVSGQLIGMVNPMLKAPFEAWAGKQFFNDLPLRDTYKPVPGTWSIIPGLMQGLSIVGKMPFVPLDAPVNEKGQWYMKEKDAYMLGQYIPFLAQSRRLVPTEEKYQNRLVTTLLSYLAGANMRTNTPQDIEAEVFRRTRNLEGRVQLMKDTGQIPAKPTKPKRERRTTLGSALANIQPPQTPYTSSTEAVA